jgi:hypothetical protein
MTSLVSVSDVKAVINTSWGDAALQAVIDRVEWEITAKIGAPQNDGGTVDIVKTLAGEGEYLFFPVELGSIVSVVEDGSTLDGDEYQIWSGGVLERLPSGGHWGGRNVVTYKPADDRLKRKGAIIDLVRLEINRTAMKGESVAGEYSFTAPDDWERERRKIFKRLMFTAV